jgi:glycosyltransferase involved in cell wall biosynthesis
MPVETLNSGLLVPTPPQASGRDEIAVIIPVYMGKAVLRELCQRLVESLEQITNSFSVILVDDRSPDDPWTLIRAIGEEDPRIKGIQLSRNFGQHCALTAGIDYANADWYVVMDCDLQDAPEDIPILYGKAREGYDMVIGMRRKEGHGFAKRGSSRLFYALFNLLAGLELQWEVGNFRIFSNCVADSLRQMREQMRFLPANLNFVGFHVGKAELPHHSRPEGKSSYTLRRLVRLASSIILAHSNLPLRLAAFLGLAISALSLLAAIAILVRKLLWGIAVSGWASLIVALFVIGGIQIFITGVVGIYVGKCFEEAKRRPLYFVKDISNLHDRTRARAIG